MLHEDCRFSSTICSRYTSTNHNSARSEVTFVIIAQFFEIQEIQGSETPRKMVEYQIVNHGPEMVLYHL